MNPTQSPTVKPFFDPVTCTITYVVSDPATGYCAVIDPVLDYDPASGRTATGSADAVCAHVEGEGLSVAWILETHVHADHLTASAYLKDRLGGRSAVGSGVREVQKTFGALFNAGADFATDGSQFDHLFEDNETFEIGELTGVALHTPGHTPACTCYHVGDAVFPGDTVFMPDAGTGRCDFPGGSAATLYHSLGRILQLPAETRMFICHDYGADGVRETLWETTVGEQRSGNIHCRDDVSEAEFVEMRVARDATLKLPRLILPSVQINMRAGMFPPAEENGANYLKIPLNAV